MKIFTCRRQLMFVVCLLLGCLSMQAADDGLITEQVTLNGVLAGSLPTIITDDNKNLITNLKINGEINGTDLKFIREMAGRSVNGDETEGKLSILDLSDTKIVSGGKRYFHDMVNGASYFTKDDEIGDNAFYQCSGLKSLTLPDGITLIGEKAFLRCTGLTNITIPEGVTFIGMSAFIYCRNLTSITIPAGVTTISSFTFSCCFALKNLTIPSGLTSLSNLHITDISTTIESVYVSSSVPATAGSFFDGVDLSNCTLYVPKGMIWNYKLADVWKNFGKIIEYDTTGIDKVTTRSDVKEISRFSLDGQRLTAPTKGMNIVVYSDGSIKKVAVQ